MGDEDFKKRLQTMTEGEIEALLASGKVGTRKQKIAKEILALKRGKRIERQDLSRIIKIIIATMATIAAVVIAIKSLTD